MTEKQYPFADPSHAVYCEACKARGKTWEGSDPQCAFPPAMFGGHPMPMPAVFTPKNWKCATIDMLRDIAWNAYERQSLARKPDPAPNINIKSYDDQWCATFNLLPCEHFPRRDREEPSDFNTPMVLTMGWYKQHGCTESLYIVPLSGRPYAPTEQECLAIIQHYKEFLDDNND